MSEEKVRPILVPWDFTDVAKNALLHAFQISLKDKNPIYLLNVVKEEKDLEVAQNELKKTQEDIIEKYDRSVEVIAKEGSIFSTISDVALELDALMVLMGTHGIKGMQKLTGSWALKVVASSKIPFIVVQGPPKHDSYTNIVFPVDFRKESKQKLQWVGYLAKSFNSTVHIFVPRTSDELLAKKINTNLEYAKKYLENKDITYEITQSMAKGTFAKQTLDFARYIDADMIAIVITKDLTINDYIFGAEEQKIIANNMEIPVMCINPNTDLSRYSNFLGL